MITFVYAQDVNGGIGVNNQLPWHLPEDLKFFKKVTMGHTIVMGRKTFESMGCRLLPGRKSVVLTHEKDYGATIDGLKVIHSKEEILALSEDEDLMIIGGAEIFNLFWHEVDQIIRTYIDAVFDCDVFMPAIDRSRWQLVQSEECTTETIPKLTYYFEYWKRNDNNDKEN